MSRDDQTRFSNLVMPHLTDCFALARWLTGNATDAEDVVQEACLRAYRAINGYAGGNPRAWLLAIVRNAAFSWLKENRPAETISIDDFDTIESSDKAGSGSAEGSCAVTPETVLMAQGGCS